MENDFFMNKIECEFVIITHNLDCDLITKELSIKPNRFFNKGDSIVSKHSNRVGFRTHGLWAIKSKTVISEEIDLSQHIKFFQKILSDKIILLERLKNKYGFEYIFSISIETEDAGIGIDLSQSEISFMGKVVDRFSCSFICKNSIG